MSDANFTDDSGAVRLRGRFGGGGSQPAVPLILGHTAAFANLFGSIPVAPQADAGIVAGALTLPPTEFGNDGFVYAQIWNTTDSDINIASGQLIVQNADGSVWLERDTSTVVVVPPTGGHVINFETAGGGAGAGLSWDGDTLHLVIASAGVYSAFVSLSVQPA